MTRQYYAFELYASLGPSKYHGREIPKGKFHVFKNAMDRDNFIKSMGVSYIWAVDTIEAKSYCPMPFKLFNQYIELFGVKHGVESCIA